jgi:hypothetical protein
MNKDEMTDCMHIHNVSQHQFCVLPKRIIKGRRDFSNSIDDLVYFACCNRLFKSPNEMRNHRELGIIAKQSVVVCFSALSQWGQRAHGNCSLRETAVNSEVVSRELLIALGNVCFKLKLSLFLSFF